MLIDRSMVVWLHGTQVSYCVLVCAWRKCIHCKYGSHCSTLANGMLLIIMETFTPLYHWCFMQKGIVPYRTSPPAAQPFSYPPPYTPSGSLSPSTTALMAHSYHAPNPTPSVPNTMKQDPLRINESSENHGFHVSTISAPISQHMQSSHEYARNVHESLQRWDTPSTRRYEHAVHLVMCSTNIFDIYENIMTCALRNGSIHLLQFQFRSIYNSIAAYWCWTSKR